MLRKAAAQKKQKTLALKVKTVQHTAVDVSALCKALPRGRCNNCRPCLKKLTGKARCVRSAARELGLPGALLSCLGHQAVGMLIAVAWPEDETSYEALVTGFDAGTGRHDVTYTLDGVKEQLKLYTTELNILARCDGDDGDEGEDGVGPAQQHPTPPAKPPPTVNITVRETPEPDPMDLPAVDCSDSDEEEMTRHTAAII